LEIDRTAQSLRDALELNQHAVPGGLDDAAPALGDRRVDQFQPHRLHPGERSLLVNLHESAVSNDVRRHDRGKTTLYARRFHPADDPI